MVTLRLFHQSDPFRQIEARTLDEGELTIGRDAAADWVVPDPDRAVSRLHCVVSRRDGRISLRDTSSNGVLLGEARTRLAPLEPTPVAAGETFRMGDYLVVIDGPDPAEELFEGAGFDAPFTQPMLKDMAVRGQDVSVPSQWSGSEAAEPPRAVPDGALLEAFCAGARLDASAFSGEDPVEVMRRLGAVYQQMVLGLGDLMGERTTLKTEYRMTRTTVHAEGNNPFKWAPPHRVAVDLLRARDDGFLSGPAAVKASFEDLKKHLLCILAGLRAALGATLDNLDPAGIEGQDLLPAGPRRGGLGRLCEPL
jgi:predicted component of type VI protein secretion system